MTNRRSPHFLPHDEYRRFRSDLLLALSLFAAKYPYRAQDFSAQDLLAFVSWLYGTRRVPTDSWFRQELLKICEQSPEILQVRPKVDDNWHFTFVP